jgi:hypothetical protein
MKKTVNKRRKGNVISVDFTGVKSGWGTVPDGRYAAKITAVEQKERKESGEPYLELTWEITSEKCNGREVRFDNYSLQPQALWRLKSLLEAMEIEVPDGEQDIDFDELISDETECIIEVTGEKSPNGDRTYARVTGHGLLSDGGTVDDDGDDDPKDNKKVSSKGKSTSDDSDDDEEEQPAKKSRKGEDEDDDEPPKRRGKAKEEDEEDDDEDEPPKKAGKIKKGAKVKFKDEKNKLTKGTIESINGDTAIVVSDADDTYELDLEDLTVIG